MQLVLFPNRVKAAKMTDKRVKFMNEVITGIRIIKMYAWEYAFINVVESIRKYVKPLIHLKTYSIFSQLGMRYISYSSTLWFFQ